MRLHRARSKSERPAERIERRLAIEAAQPGDRCDRPEDTGSRRPEEFEWASRRESERGNDIDPGNERGEKCLAVIGARPIDLRQKCGKDRCKRMRNRTFMYAIIFLRMDLEGVGEGRVGRGQRRPGPTQHSAWPFPAPLRGKVEDAIGIRCIAPGHADAQRIVEKGPRRLLNRGGQACPLDRQRAIDEDFGSVHRRRSTSSNSAPSGERITPARLPP